MSRIGIAVTTRNRPGMLHQCLYNIEKYSPVDRFLAVVDDASETPTYHPFKAPGFAHVFPTNVGVARAKNKSIELLMEAGCDQLFLFDDDTWPTDHGWWEPYVASGIEHLSYTWAPAWDPERHGCDVGGGVQTWSTANGCLLYYTRKAIDVAGGMRTLYGKWGFEHLDHSYRIHKLGVTPHPFMSLVDQSGIHASDEHDDGFKSTISSITPEARAEAKLHGEAKYLYWREKAEKVAYA